MTLGGEGVRTPPTDGSYYGPVILPDEGDLARVVPDGINTGSIAIKCISTSESVYLGWDQDVDETEGFPLEEGESLSLDLDSDSQGIWAYSTTSDPDELRVIATN